MIFIENKKKFKSVIFIILIGSIILGGLKCIEIYRNKQNDKQVIDFIKHWEKFESDTKIMSLSDEEIPQRAYDIYDLIVNKRSLTEINSYKKELNNIRSEIRIKNKNLVGNKYSNLRTKYDEALTSRIRTKSIDISDRKVIEQKLESAWDKFFNRTEYRSANEDLEAIKDILSKYKISI